MKRKKRRKKTHMNYGMTRYINRVHGSRKTWKLHNVKEQNFTNSFAAVGLGRVNKLFYTWCAKGIELKMCGRCCCCKRLPLMSTSGFSSKKTFLALIYLWGFFRCSGGSTLPFSISLCQEMWYFRFGLQWRFLGSLCANTFAKYHESDPFQRDHFRFLPKHVSPTNHPFQFFFLSLLYFIYYLLSTSSVAVAVTALPVCFFLTTKLQKPSQQTSSNERMKMDRN